METGRLDEHQASPDTTTTQPGQYAPSDEERKAVKLVEKSFEKAKKWREKYDHKWNDYYKMFRGKQWKEERPSYRTTAVFNQVFRVIQSQAPVLTDSRPKIEFLPQEPSDREIAEILNQVAESDWERHNWLMTLVEIIYDINIYGTGFGFMGYDKTACDGLGEILFESFDPFYAFPEPYSKNINHRTSKKFVTAEPIPIDHLKAEYPDKAKFIKPDLIDFMDGDKEDVYTTRYKSPNDRNVLEGTRDYSSITDNDRALKTTLWCLDEETTEEKKSLGLNEQGVEAFEVTQKKKYPRGRKIVTSNKVLLEDHEIEFEDGKFPYAKLVNYMLSREFFGISEIEQVEGPQLFYNKVFSFVLDVLELMGNPVWVISSDSGIDTDNLYNRPGMVLEPNPGSTVQRVEGVQLQPYVINLLQTIGEQIKDIAGDSDVSRGVKAEGITAAKAIQALQESGHTRLRQKSRFLDAFLQDIGQMYLSRVLQFRTVPQVYRLTNNENVSNYFKFHVETVDTPEGSKKIAKYREVFEDDKGKTVFGDERAFEIQGKFDVRVGTGSSLPFAVAEKEQRAYALFDRQIIDAEEVLKTVDWPNKEAVAERMASKAEEMAAAQQSAGQPA